MTEQPKIKTLLDKLGAKVSLLTELKGYEDAASNLYRSVNEILIELPIFEQSLIVKREEEMAALFEKLSSNNSCIETVVGGNIYKIIMVNCGKEKR